MYEEHGLHVMHASDEWYILAGEELPEEERYDGYLQLENGVGMLRLLENEFEEAFENLKERCKDVGTDWVDFRTFDGTHQFCMDDEPIQKLIGDLFSAG